MVATKFRAFLQLANLLISSLSLNLDVVDRVDQNVGICEKQRQNNHVSSFSIPTISVSWGIFAVLKWAWTL